MQKLKAIALKITLFLLFFLIIFHAFDFYCSTIEPQYSWIYENNKGVKLVQYIKNYKLQHKYSIKFDAKAANDMLLADKYSDAQDNTLYEKYRPIENKNAKDSILIFGCSFAYGNSLNNQETFSYNLGKNLPNYAIYNRAQDGWSTSHMLYQLENKNFLDIKNLKYIIYVYVDDHFARNNYYRFVTPISPYYKNTKSGLVELQKHTLKYIVCPATIVAISNIYEIYYKLAIPINVNLTKNILLLSKEILDFEHKGTKFIILRYDNGEYNAMFEELEKEGVIVLSVNDLSKIDYNTTSYRISETDVCPNAKAWQEITPLFVKYMRDRGYLKD